MKSDPARSLERRKQLLELNKAGLHQTRSIRISCKDCGKSYVGQTLRTLEFMIKEHQ